MPGHVATLFEDAANDIKDRTNLPGMSPTVPGAWEIGGKNQPATVIGVIISDALARVCRAKGEVHDHILERFVQLNAELPPLVPKGAPNTVAVSRLRQAAERERALC